MTRLTERIKWHRWILFFTILTVGIGGGTAHAYTVWGPKWPGGNPGYGYDTSFSNQGPGWASRLGDAVAEWNAISLSNNAFWFRYDNASNNRVQAANLSTDSACRPNPAAPACLGLARRWKSLFGNDFTKFEIVVNTGSGYAFYDGTQAPSLPRNYYDLRSLMRHELGHGLGLCHSANSAAVMEGSQPTGVDEQIVADDRNGLRYLYWPGYNLTTPSGGCIP